MKSDFLSILAALLILLPGTAAIAQAEDPHAYLEEIEGARALAFARAENARSLSVLQGDPRYPQLYADALAIATSADRIPTVTFANDGSLRNFWQDATHVRGIWRTTDLANYAKGAPAWKTILDLDAVSKAENRNWVWKGVDCLPPEETRCLIHLSDGGKDAVTVREYDVAAGKFVDGGFVSPESKQDLAWLDRDTLLIGADFGPGTMTSSSYPFIIKEWKRGTPLASAREAFRGLQTDMAVSPVVLRNPDGAVQAVLVQRYPSFFEVEQHLRTEAGFVRLPLPLKSTLQSFVDDQLVFSLEQDWSERGFKEGDVIAFDLAALKADPAQAKADLVLRPSPSQGAVAIAATRTRLVVAIYENVKGALYSYRHGPDGWTATKLDLPADMSVSLGAAAEHNDQLMVTTANFLTPTTQYLFDAASGKRETLRTLPAKFDASKHVVEQLWATSKDGTKVPYFVVRPKGLQYDGSAPTLLYAYGGFEVSLTPSYSGSIGKLWLERGAVYVVANIRGGGEFGPRWHNAGLKLDRMRVYDDFFAVSEDLIARKITSPRRLGVMGGSNGGLLMGVALTQRPELYNAIVVQVPLFDMIGYTKLSAGASWIGEYGDPAIPAERAMLESYSPYQNLKAGRKYPEVYIDTSTKDDRVHPAHARKAAARLKDLGYSYLYYENIDGGHSAAANLEETARRVALEFTYLTRKLID
jgi:prolyl oligopeptidase